MTLARFCVAAIIIALAWPAHAQPPQAPAPTPPTPTPSPQSPGAPQMPGAPGTATTTPQATTLQPATARTFTAPIGMWFVTVRPDRVADFEQVIAHLQAALAKSTDARTLEQAKGWRTLKASEPGPNATALYVFLIDRTIPGADYGLGGVLASAYPDTTQLAEIWRMYTGAITGGGSLLNLTAIAPTIVPFGEKSTPGPVAPSAVPAPTTPPTTVPAPRPAVPKQ